MSEPGIVSLQDLSFTYRSAGSPALNQIDLDLAPDTFSVLMGPSGSGKSTLCQVLNAIIPSFKKGTLSGSARLFDRPLGRVKPNDLLGRVGMIFQDFESQLFCTNAELEVAFGLENLGLPPRVIRERVVRYLELTGLSGFMEREPATLSGGEKQRLALAAVLAMEPRLLILDEPTTDLDPQGKEDVFRLVKQLITEKSMTILMVEHDIHEVKEADQWLVLRDGALDAVGAPADLMRRIDLLERASLEPLAIPSLFHRAGARDLPVDADAAVRSMREHGLSFSPVKYASMAAADQARQDRYGAGIIEFEAVTHRYGPEKTALDRVSLKVREREFVAVLGQNGSGKTTLVKHINGLLVPSEGTVRLKGEATGGRSLIDLGRSVGYVFQNPDHQIFSNTVAEEVAFGPSNRAIPDPEKSQRIREALEAVHLVGFEDRDPFTLTKGERQRVAVASVLATRPDIIVFDEPTTGLDYRQQLDMMELIRRLNDQGITILIVTHAMWVAAAYAHRTVILKDGAVIADAPTREVFSRPDLLARSRLKMPDITEFTRGQGMTCLSVDEALACLERS